MPKARILDAGCGSGRDTAAFFRTGFSVDAFDGSAELAAIAASRLQRHVRHLYFEDMDYDQAFDGLWCSASLIHVEPAFLALVLAKCRRALRPGGVWYASVKSGEGSWISQGRYFAHYTREKLENAVGRVGGLEALDYWQTPSPDQTPNETWEHFIWQRCDG